MKKILLVLALLFFSGMVAAAAWLPLGPTDQLFAGQPGSFSGIYTDMQMDSLGNPHVIYYDEDNSLIYYQYWNGSSWITSTFPDSVLGGSELALALDSNDKPHVFFTKNFGPSSNQSDLMYMYMTSGSVWTLPQNVTSNSNGDIGSYDIEFDALDRLHLAYNSGSTVTPGTEQTYYMLKTGTTWSSPVNIVQDPSERTQLGVSIAIDSLNNPHVAYMGNMDIFYKYFDGFAWVPRGTVKVSNCLSFCQQPSLALDSSDIPHIVWNQYDSSGINASDVSYKYWNGSSWAIRGPTLNISNLHTASGTGVHKPDIEIDSLDNPHVVWRDCCSNGFAAYYTKWTGFQWTPEEYTTINGSGVPKLGLDLANNPNIVIGDRGKVFFKKFDPNASAPDLTPPVTTSVLSGTFDAANNWYTTDVIVTLSATDDDSGVFLTEYSVDGAAFQIYTAPFVVTGNQQHYIQFRSQDNAGNLENVNFEFFTIEAQAQNPELNLTQNWQFTNPFGVGFSELSDVELNETTGDFYIAGATDCLNDFVNNFYTAKFDALGSKVWDECLAPGRVYVVEEDSQGNAISAGAGVGGRGAPDTFILVKYDASGNQVFSIVENGGGGDYYAKSLALDSADNIYVTIENGTWLNNSSLRKYSPTGALAWEYFLPSDCRPNQVLVGTSDNTYVSAICAVGFGTEVKVFKVSPSGSLLWDSAYSASSVDKLIMSLDASNNVSFAFSDFSAINTVKYSFTGSQIFADVYNTGNSLAYFSVDDSGNAYAVSGDFFSEVLVRKLNIIGQEQWVYSYTPVAEPGFTTSVLLPFVSQSLDGKSVEIDSLGNVWISVSVGKQDTANFTFVEKGQLLKFDSSGNLLGTQDVVVPPSTTELLVRTAGDNQFVGFMTYDPNTFDQFKLSAIRYGTEPFVLPDTTPPETTITLDGTFDRGLGAYISNVTVTLDATDDDSGVSQTFYNLDAAGFVPYTGPFVVSAAGSHTVEYYSVDVEGNIETSSIELFAIAIQDTVPPVTVATVSGTPQAPPYETWYEKPVVLTLTATDDSSGVAYIEYREKGASVWETYTGPITFNYGGKKTWQFRAVDNAGNVENKQEIQIKIDRDKDGDGIYNHFDQCKEVPGSEEFFGCPFADKTRVNMSIFDLGTFDLAKIFLEDIQVKVFDRTSADFKAAIGADGLQKYDYGVVYETNAGLVGDCTTETDGRCFVYEEEKKKYLVVGKFVDPVTGRAVYKGKKKVKSDFNEDGLATKHLKFIQILLDGETVDYRAGNTMDRTDKDITVVRPVSSIWYEDEKLYPFGFETEGEYEVSLCAEVPKGYKITGFYDENGDFKNFRKYRFRKILENIKTFAKSLKNCHVCDDDDDDRETSRCKPDYKSLFKFSNEVCVDFDMASEAKAVVFQVEKSTCSSRKTQVCYVPRWNPSNAKSICVSKWAARLLVRGSSYYGPCEGEVLPEPTLNFQVYTKNLSSGVEELHDKNVLDILEETFIMNLEDAQGALGGRLAEESVANKRLLANSPATGFVIGGESGTLLALLLIIALVLILGEVFIYSGIKKMGEDIVSAMPKFEEPKPKKKK